MADDTTQKGLTIKQRKWMDLYLKLGNATEAAMKVYRCKNREIAATIGWENIRKLDFGDLMEAAGITDEKLSKTLDEGLKAQKILSAVVIKKGKPTSQVSGELPLAQDDTTDFIDVPDHATRHKFLETALKLKKRLVDRADLTSEGEKIKIIDANAILEKVYGQKNGGSSNEMPNDS